MSRSRGEVLQLLFRFNNRKLHVRALERESEVTIGAIGEELEKLRDLDLLKEETEDPGRKFGIAYNAALKLCTAIIHASGFRATRDLNHDRRLGTPSPSSADGSGTVGGSGPPGFRPDL